MKGNIFENIEPLIKSKQYLKRVVLVLNFKNIDFKRIITYNILGIINGV